ncbi:MAG: hypothetical protein KKA54_14840 [Proteobacteria bacterium]|nr:hypothetical protein [Pseudomonadota bacterium]
MKKSNNLPAELPAVYAKSTYLPYTPPNLQQNSGDCNHRPGELRLDLSFAVLNAGKSDCRIALSGAAAAIKMPSKKQLPATWLAGD